MIFQVVTDTRIDTFSRLNGYSTHLKVSDYFLTLEIACKIANLNSTLEYTNFHRSDKKIPRFSLGKIANVNKPLGPVSTYRLRLRCILPPLLSMVLDTPSDGW